MALKPCPTCGGNISPRARACVHCGAPFRVPFYRDPHVGLLGCLSLFLVPILITVVSIDAKIGDFWYKSYALPTVLESLAASVEPPPPRPDPLEFNGESYSQDYHATETSTFELAEGAHYLRITNFDFRFSGSGTFVSLIRFRDHEKVEGPIDSDSEGWIQIEEDGKYYFKIATKGDTGKWRIEVNPDDVLGHNL